MLHRNQNNRIRLSLTKLFLDVADCIGVIRDAIGQSILKIVRRNDDHSNINMAVLKVVPDVDDVSGKKITPTRDLNLYADAGNNRLVVAEPLHPINIAALGLNPFSVFTELGVNHLSDDASAVRLLLVEHANICGNENLLKLKKDVCQSEPTYLLSRSSVKLDLAYLHG